MATKSSQEWFFYTRRPDEGKGAWDVRISEMRAEVFKEDFMFYTVLEVDRIITKEFKAADRATTSYRGPFYLDWDGEDVMDAVAGAKRFINTLETAYALDPDFLRIYLSGSRGVHVEIDPEIFWTNRTGPERGLPYLYAVYGGMALKLATPCLDLRIYTGRMGRMWRRPNQQRGNGLYKVQVTWDELCSINSDEDYKAFCQAPRRLFSPSMPTKNEKLSLLFVEERNRVTEKMKMKSEITKTDFELFEKYRGTLPPSLQNLVGGRGIDHSKGWNQICLQMAISLHRFGIIDREMAVAQVDALIRTHIQQPGVSHSDYDSALEHFIQIFDYVGSTECYEYSKPALLSVMTEKAQGMAKDLDGVDVVLTPEGDIQVDFDSLGRNYAMLMSHTEDKQLGFVRRKQSGEQEVVLDLVVDWDSLVEVQDDINPSGSYSQVTVQNALGKRTVIEFDPSIKRSPEIFKDQVCIPAESIIKNMSGDLASDFDLRARQELNRLRSAGAKAVTTVGWEGLNVRRRKDGSWAVFWAGPKGCYGAISEGEFRFSTISDGKRGVFGSLLPQEPLLTGSEDEKTLMHTLLNLNGNPFTMGAVVGWFVGTFVRPFVVHRTGKWPLLCVVGQKGTGKSTTMDIMNGMFYGREQTPMMFTASGGGTEYGWQAAACSSCSIPMVMDEVKKTSMGQDVTRKVETLLHNLYNTPFSILKGGGAVKGTVARNTHRSLSAIPMAYIGEFHDQRAAVQERSVIANFENKSKYGREGSVYTLQSNRQFISSLGRTCLEFALQLNPDTVPAEVDKAEARIREIFGSRGCDRLKYNQACMVISLEFFRTVLNTLYGDEFDGKIDTFIAAMQDPSYIENMDVNAEVVQAMEDMAHLSHLHPDLPYSLQAGKHYDLTEKYLDMNVREVFDHYALYCRHLGMPKLLDDITAFRKSLGHSDLFVEFNPTDSDLSANGVHIVRLDREKFEAVCQSHFKE